MSSNLSVSSKLLGNFLLSSAVGAILIVIRILWSNSPFYGFMIWNLFLAWIPFVAAYYGVRQKNKWLRTGFLLVWFFFFPNAPYIITDFFHLYYREPIPLWYDLAHLTLFSWTGMWLGFISLNIVHRWLGTYLKKWQSRLIISVVIMLSGFGIYLGRYLRWNSWDILTNPGQIFLDMLDMAIDPFAYPTAWGVTIIFGVLLALMYGTMCSVITYKEK